ncbi:MAG: ribonuclease P protein component [Burkholderiaceae bacterium]
MLLSIPQSVGFSEFLRQRPYRRTARLQLLTSASCGLCRFARLGILVPKRHVSRAVDRHLLKRLIRQAFVQWKKKNACAEHQAGPCGPECDILVRLVRPVQHIGQKDREQWWLELEKLFSKP